MTQSTSKNAEFSHFLHSGYFNLTLREWQTNQSDYSAKNLMYPLFIV